VLVNAKPGPDGWAWWAGRRWLTFSLAVGVGYAAGVLAYELATPWWAGDHIGLSAGALLFYGIVGLIWVAALNVVYALPWVAERFVSTSRVDAYRRRAYAVAVALGAASWPAWLAVTVLVGKLRQR